MRIENFPKLKQSDHSPKRDKFIDVSSDPLYFSLDSPFKTLKPVLLTCQGKSALNFQKNTQWPNSKAIPSIVFFLSTVVFAGQSL